MSLLALLALALLPTAASAQYVPPDTTPPTVAPEPPVTPGEPGPPSTRPEPPVSPPASPSSAPPRVEPDEVVNNPVAQPAKPAPQVRGDVVTRPLPRTGNDIGGTAVFGGALTVLGIALALGARKRRNSFDGA